MNSRVAVALMWCSTKYWPCICLVSSTSSNRLSPPSLCTPSLCSASCSCGSELFNPPSCCLSTLSALSVMFPPTQTEGAELSFLTEVTPFLWLHPQDRLYLCCAVAEQHNKGLSHRQGSVLVTVPKLNFKQLVLFTPGMNCFGTLKSWFSAWMKRKKKHFLSSVCES